MSSDETYLEAFVESLTTLPHEVRRQMDLMKDLDTSSSASEARLRALHQEYIRVAEERMTQLELVQQPDGTKVRVLHGDATTLPTTAELERFIYQPTYPEILKLQHECLQKADEKVAIARQAYDMMDATVRRLDRDLHEMESILQSSGDFYEAKVDDLAACQPTPNSEWILAKVLHHDPMTGVYKLADEDVESDKSMLLCCLSGFCDLPIISHTHLTPTLLLLSFSQSIIYQNPKSSFLAWTNSIEATMSTLFIPIRLPFIRLRSCKLHASRGSAWSTLWMIPTSLVSRMTRLCL
jgi:hypothetical protein